VHYGLAQIDRPATVVDGKPTVMIDVTAGASRSVVACR